MEAVKADGSLLTVTEYGYGKQTKVDEYRITSRGGLGIINIDTSERNGKVVAVAHLEPTDEVLIVTQQGMIIRTPASGVRMTGRAAQGVRLINIDDTDRVVGIATLDASETPAPSDSDSPEASAANAVVGADVSTDAAVDASSEGAPDGGDTPDGTPTE